MSTVQPKLPVYWIPDANSNECKLCRQNFGYLLTQFTGVQIFFIQYLCGKFLEQNPSERQDFHLFF